MLSSSAACNSSSGILCGSFQTPNITFERRILSVKAYIGAPSSVPSALCAIGKVVRSEIEHDAEHAEPQQTCC